MLLSEVTPEILADHLSISGEEEKKLLPTYMCAAIAYITAFTGLLESELDNYPDITVATFCICQDMFDNRGMTVYSDKENPTVKQILSMHSRNFL